MLPESEPATARAASSVRVGGGRCAGYPGSGRRNIPPGRAPSGGPGCMGRGAAGGSGRRLPALPPCPERRLSRARERGRGAREGAEEGPAAGRERQGSSAASPLPLPARPPAAAAAAAELRHRPGEAGRAGPSLPPRRARPCPVSCRRHWACARAPQGRAGLGGGQGASQRAAAAQPSQPPGSGGRCEESAACPSAPLGPALPAKPVSFSSSTQNG